MEADATPRQRVKEWVQRQLAADPTLGAHDLAERALAHFADDAEVLALALRQAARPEAFAHDEEDDG